MSIARDITAILRTKGYFRVPHRSAGHPLQIEEPIQVPSYALVEGIGWRSRLHCTGDFPAFLFLNEDGSPSVAAKVRLLRETHGNDATTASYNVLADGHEFTDVWLASSDLAESYADGGVWWVTGTDDPRGTWVVRPAGDEVRASWWGVKGDGTTNDRAGLQAALDYLAGLPFGGRLILGAGVFFLGTDGKLNAGNNTRVTGAGPGVSTLLGGEGAYEPADVNGTQFGATIGAVGKRNVIFEGFTVDHATNETIANGIELVPDGQFEGAAVCEDSIVRDCEVLGFVEHEYMIWSMRGRRIQLLRNRVDGGATSFPDGNGQEGIEVFGGYDVLVQGNTILRIANAGLNLGAANDVAGAECMGVRAIDNYVDQCQYGVFSGTASDSTDDGEPQNISNLQVRGNVIRRCFYDGVRLTQEAASGAGTVLSNVEIADNQIDGCNVGIRCLGKAADASNINVRVVGNAVAGSLSAVEGAITVSLMAGVAIEDNGLATSAGYDVYLANSPDVIVAGNRTDRTNKAAVIADDCDRLVVRGNDFKDPSQAGADSFVTVLITNSDDGLVEHNTFKRAAGYVEVLIADTCNRFTMAKNRKLYSSVYATPFSNQSVGGVTE